MATRPEIKPIKDDLLKWNIWVYADPGVGKTVLASSDEKVLMWVPEIDGIMSAQTFGKGTTGDRVLMPDLETLMNAIEWYEENPEELKQWEVLSIDSVSEMQYLTKKYVLEQNEEEKRRKDQDPFKMQIQDYGEMHEILEDIVRRINDLPINVFYTATAKKVEDADKHEFLVPDLQGKKDYGVAMKIASLMTSYGYMRVEVHEVASPTDEDDKATKQVKRRVIYWEDTGTIRGKDRTNKLKPFIVSPTLAGIRKAISGEMVRNSEGKIVKRTGDSNGSAKPAAKRPAIKKAPAQASPKPSQEVESDQSAKEGAVELDAVEA